MPQIPSQKLPAPVHKDWIIKKLLARVDRFKNITGMSDAAISLAALRDSGYLSRLRREKRKDFGVLNFERLNAWMDAEMAKREGATAHESDKTSPQDA